MITLPFAEFYITNVCDLACENCNRFNNFKRTGRIDFDRAVYEDWSKRIDVERFSIIGGEPLNHPRLHEYIKGIRNLWPNADMCITSNGLAINRSKHLYEYCVANNCSLEISLHDVDHIDKLIWEQIEHFKLYNGRNWKTRTEIIPQVGIDGEEFDIEATVITDNGGMKIDIADAHTFSSTSIKEWCGGKPLPHNSDIHLAYHNCSMKHSHTFYDGKLYKCGMIAAGKTMAQEFNAEKEWQPLFDYEPLDINKWLPYWKDTFFSAENVCSVCPEVLQYGKCNTKIKGT